MLLNPSQKQLSANQALDGQGSDETFRSHRSPRGRGLPTTTGSLFDYPAAEQRSAVTARHVGFCPRFVDKDQVARVHFLRRGSSRGALLDPIWPILLARHQRHFVETVLAHG